MRLITVLTISTLIGGCGLTYEEHKQFARILESSLTGSSQYGNSYSSSGNEYYSSQNTNESEVYVTNKSYCLSVDSSRANTIGDMAYLENRCSSELKVTYCFGMGTCDTNRGSTSVDAYDKRTIFYDKDEYTYLSLLAFACESDVDFSDCQSAVRDYFEYK
ncbi:MAG: hypothetical protein KDI92_01380 [Xanthomonadales bacterium]|nr:hypothetical protein [Xanthomonadales bacterium]